MNKVGCWIPKTNVKMNYAINSLSDNNFGLPLKDSILIVISKWDESMKTHAGIIDACLDR